jgi:hypothetical protein
MPVKTIKRAGKFRVVETNTGKIAKKGRTPVDGGGHSTKAKAQSQVRAINRRNNG